MSEISRSSFAHVNWKKLPEGTPASARKIDKGETRLTTPQRNRRGTYMHEVGQKPPFKSHTSDQVRFYDYQRLINDLINGSITDDQANEKLQEIWEQNRQALGEGGALDMSVIKKTINDLFTEGVLTKQEISDLLEIIQTGKRDRAKTNEYQTQWDHTIESSAVRQLDSNDFTEPGNSETLLPPIAPLTQEEAATQLVKLLSDSNLREKWVQFLQKMIARSNPQASSDAVEDIIQLYVEKLLKHRHDFKYREIENLNSYLLVGLKRAMFDYFKKRKYVNVLLDEAETINLFEDPATTQTEERDIESTQRNTNTVKQIIAFVKNEIPGKTGKFFGDSFKKNLAEGMFERNQRVLLGKLAGKTTIEVILELAQEDAKFATKYAKGIEFLKTQGGKPKKSTDSELTEAYTQFVKARNIVDQIFNRAKQRVIDEFNLPPQAFRRDYPAVVQD